MANALGLADFAEEIGDQELYEETYRQFSDELAQAFNE